MAQPFPTGMAPGHPGMGGHGHPMGMQHPAGAHMGGPPGPGMMQGMQPGVSGPHVSQSPMVTGMPVGPGTPAPGPMHNGSMAMAHLGPQQHMFPQQNQMAFGGMQMSQQQAQQAMMRQQMMQRIQQQGQQPGMPMNMPGHPVNQAQLAQMKLGGMPMQPQQMQAFQQHAQGQQMANQHRILQAHHQQQQAMNLAAQNQQRQQQQAQQMQLTRSQEQQTTQPPQPHPTPAPQNQGPPQPQPTPQVQNQQPKPQPQQPPATTQAPSAPTPQVKQNESEDSPQIKQQDMAGTAMVGDMPADGLNGRHILQLIMFQDALAAPDRPNDLYFWEVIVAKFFASFGSLKQQFINTRTGTDKSFQLQFPSLARYFHAHFGAGIKQILLQSYKHVQSRYPNGSTAVSSEDASLTHVYHNDIRITVSGQLSVLFDESNKIVRFDLSATGWQEYVPKTLLLQAQSPDQKQSPKMNKNLKKVQQQGKSAPELNIPSSGVGEFGVPSRLIGFLEVCIVPGISRDFC
jgi:hypothetical protein